jgi:hypothetical protein
MTEEEALQKLQNARNALKSAGSDCGKTRGNTGGWRAESAYQAAANALEQTYEEVRDFLPADVPITVPLRGRYLKRGKAPQR